VGVIRLRWGNPQERERCNRIRVAVYAYAYEFEDSALVPDSEYDALARSIQPAMPTGNPMLDNFFRNHYSSDTGMWIRLHPDLAGIERIYRQHYIR
jgi:hypothetical protein